MDPTNDHVIGDVLVLADLLTVEWPAVRERIKLSGHPICEGDDDAGDADADAGDNADVDADAGDGTDDDAKGDDDKPDAIDPADRVARGDTAAVKARKWERQAKRAREERDRAVAEARDLKAASQTDQERALAEARAQARTEVLAEMTPKQKGLALELAVTKVATVKGITIGEGDDAKTVKFSDPDDVQMWLERQIRAGDIDEADIFSDDGRVDRDALTDALTTLAAEKPTWLAGATNGSAPRAAGDADAGKGRGAKDPDKLSVEEHMKHIQRR